MEIKIIIPSPLRNLSNGERSVNIELDENSTILDSINKLDDIYSGISAKIIDKMVIFLISIIMKLQIKQ